MYPIFGILTSQNIQMSNLKEDFLKSREDYNLVKQSLAHMLAAPFFKFSFIKFIIRAKNQNMWLLIFDFEWRFPFSVACFFDILGQSPDF
jgi:hypothetical protein